MITTIPIVSNTFRPSRGTRFRPLSLSHPKPLFPIAGKPMVFHYMQAFASLEQMEEILLIGFFEPALFQPFIDEVASQFQSINIRYLREYQPLGTGGWTI